MTLGAWVDPSTVTGAWRDVIYEPADEAHARPSHDANERVTFDRP